MSVTGDAETAPLRTGFPIADTIAGLTASFAIAAALVDQKATGRGRRIDVSLLESTLAAMGWVVFEPSQCECRSEADGQRELHRRTVGHVCDRLGAVEHRRQRAEAIRVRYATLSAGLTSRPIRALPNASRARIIARR